MARRSKYRGVVAQGASDKLEHIELSAADEAKIKIGYERALPQNTALLDEVVFILEERLRATEIRIHGIEKRIKTVDSVIGKCRRKGIADQTLLTDIAAARVVCLFRSDMDRVGRLLKENFEVIEVDDKLSSEHGPLGYLSVHYSCKMPMRYKGPRYEKTSEIIFEIQVRTLCMHAWAAVSHYLDYKGEWDVPDDLKRALGALSGLFYVADNEFEQFYAARLASQKQAQEKQKEDDEREINLDTVTAYLRDRFPVRHVPEPDLVSPLVHQLKEAGYSSLSAVDVDIQRALNLFEEFEKEYPPGSGRGYNAVGAARLSLGIASRKFYGFTERSKVTQNDPLLAYQGRLS
jgi:ppGpp synthetase/RelA/SpoT-type nucleotidyltranferase